MSSSSPPHVADQIQKDLSKRLRQDFLEAASIVYASLCPQLARHLTSAAGPRPSSAASTRTRSLTNIRSKIAASRNKNGELSPHCMHCHSLMETGSCKVKLLPRARVTPSIHKLKMKPAGGLSAKEKKKLESWKNRKNVLVFTCLVCRGSSRFLCASRQSRPISVQSSDSAASGTISGSSSKKRRRSEGQSLSQESHAMSQSPPSKKAKRQNTSSTATPIRATRVDSSSALASSGRQSRSAKKDRYRQLQKMLSTAKEEQKASAESPLSRFLTSL